MRRERPLLPRHRGASSRRAWLAALALGGLGLRGAQAAPSDATPAPIRWPASVPLLDGRRLDGAMLAERTVVVVFWGTHCPYCQRHNRRIEKLHRAAAGTDLLVLGVATDATPQQALDHVRREGHSFANTAAHALLAPLFERRRFIPRTYLVERGGRLAKSYPGEMAEADVMEFLNWARPLAG